MMVSEKEEMRSRKVIFKFDGGEKKHVKWLDRI